MKKSDFVIPGLFLLFIMLCLPFSCSLFSDAEVNVGSNNIPGPQIPTLTSETVGIVWDKNGAATNLDQNRAGYVVGSRIADPVVIKKDDIYHIWFTGISRVDGEDYYTIRYASSADGITWVNDDISNIVLAPTDPSSFSTNPPDAKGVRVGSVIWDNEAREYKMWYRGLDSANGTWQIFFARSYNPIRDWIKHPNTYISPAQNMPVAVINPGEDFDGRQLGDLTVIKRIYFDGYESHQFYEMWYSALGEKNIPGATVESELGETKYRIMYAKSNDGLKTWEKESLPVLEPNTDAFDFGRKDCPAILYDSYKGNMLYKLWYIGQKTGEKVQKMGLAYAFSGEAFDYYSPGSYSEGLTVFPYPEPPEQCTVEIKDPTVIRDGYVYKMWYVVDIINKSGVVVSSRIHFIESW